MNKYCDMLFSSSSYWLLCSGSVPLTFILLYVEHVLMRKSLVGNLLSSSVELSLPRRIAPTIALAELQLSSIRWVSYSSPHYLSPSKRNLGDSFNEATREFSKPHIGTHKKANGESDKQHRGPGYACIFSFTKNWVRTTWVARQFLHTHRTSMIDPDVVDSYLDRYMHLTSWIWCKNQCMWQFWIMWHYTMIYWSYYIGLVISC